MRLVSYASYTSVVMFILFDIIALSSPLCCCHVYIFCIYVVSSWALLPTGFLNKILYLVSCISCVAPGTVSGRLRVCAV